MKHVLEAVERERAELEADIAECEARIADRKEQLARLDEIAQLAGDEPGAAPPKPKSAKAKPQLRPRDVRAAAAAAPQGGHTEERLRELHALIRTLEPVSKRDMVARMPYGTDTLNRMLTLLQEAGVVRATGATSNRRWHLTETLDREVADRNGKHADPKGAIRARCRADVLATIRDEPGKWSEQRIADAGAFDREQVAEVCGLLLDAGEITLSPDGTYAPVEAGAIAA